MDFEGGQVIKDFFHNLATQTLFLLMAYTVTDLLAISKWLRIVK